MCVGVCIFRRMYDSGGKTELARLCGLYISLMMFWELCAGFFFFFCRCQMCLHPLPCSPFPSLWFLHGRRVSIRASGLQEPEHSSVSVLPREVQPCLGRCICSPGASWGKRAKPWCPLACWFHLRSSPRAPPDPWTLRGGGDKLILNLNQISVCLSHAKTNDTLLDKLYHQTG